MTRINKTMITCNNCGQYKHHVARNLCKVCYKCEARFGFNRMTVLKRDRFSCADCGKTGGKINVHHLDENKKNNLPSNLVCLCVMCHTRRHKVTCKVCGKVENLTNRSQSYCKACGVVKAKEANKVRVDRWYAKHKLFI